MPAATLPTVHAVAIATFDQALAAARLRQWAATRQRLKGGHAPLVQMRGRASHTNARAVHEGAIAFCLDFEQALAELPTDLSTFLVLRYRDGQSQGSAAELIGKSTRWAAYTEPAALDALATALARRDML